MRKLTYPLISALLLLSGCEDSNRPTNAELTKAIDQYLVTNGQACTWLGQPFPINVSKSQLSLNEGVALQMTTLERAGLVQSVETVNRVQNPLGESTQQNVRRYEPTIAGKAYLRQVQAVLTKSAGFCYGTKTVDSIVNFTKPASPAPDIQVTYTYKIANLAPWAYRSDIQNEFGDVRTTVGGISKVTESVGLQLTNRGWQVPVR